MEDQPDGVGDVSIPELGGKCQTITVKEFKAMVHKDFASLDCIPPTSQTEAGESRVSTHKPKGEQQGGCMYV